MHSQQLQQTEEADYNSSGAANEGDTNPNEASINNSASKDKIR